MSELIPQIKLSPESRRNLGEWLGAELTTLEQAHADLFERIEVYWSWYDAEPAVAHKTTPWPGASNIVLPVIATAADSLIAQFYSTLYSHGKLLSGRSLNEDLDEIVPQVVDYLNWAADNEFHAAPAILNWLTEVVVIGEGVIGTRWENRERWVLKPNGSRKPERVTVSSGPLWEHIPRHRALWQGGKSPEESEVFSRQAYLSYSAVARMGQTGEWATDAVEEALAHPTQGGKTFEIEQAAARRAGRKLPGAGTGRNEYDIREVWIDAPVTGSFDNALGQQTAEAKVSTIVATINRADNTVLRVTADPYGLGHKPFYVAHLRSRGAQKSGRGAAKILEHMQRGMSTTVNQGIDSVTLANSMPFKSGDKKTSSQRLSPGQGVYDPNDTFKEINKGTTVQPANAVVSLLQVFAERALGQSDPLLGRESRSGGHPSPATNFLGMLEQGKVLTNPTMWGFRRVIGQLAEDTATMYQLFATDGAGKLVRIMGERDGGKVREFMFPNDRTMVGNVAFDVFAADESNSPEARQNAAVTRMQVSNNFAAMVLPMYQAILDPRQPPELRGVISEFIRGHTNTYIAFLEASDVDNVEDYTLLMEELENHGVGTIAQFREQAQQLLAAQGREESVPGDGVAGDEQSTGGGSPGIAGAFGVQ